MSIVFEPLTHTYKDETGFYTPVSSVISHYKAKFDSDKWSLIKARERGISQEEILEEWALNSKKSTDKGTTMHKAVEDFFRHRLESEYVAEYLPIFLKWRTSGMVFIPEQLLFSKKYRVAGTPDMVIFDPKTDTYSILDWKTNKEIKMSNRYQKMTGVCSHLDDCNYNHYFLQLNLYASLLDKPINKLSIIHLADKLTIIPVKIDLEFALKVLEDFQKFKLS